jgi:hypothetical protein
MSLPNLKSVAKTTLKKNSRYEALISLNYLESLGTNTMITDKLKGVGFVNVVVSGSGLKRMATGVWGKETQQAEIPKQVTAIKEV